MEKDAQHRAASNSTSSDGGIRVLQFPGKTGEQPRQPPAEELPHPFGKLDRSLNSFLLAPSLQRSRQEIARTRQSRWSLQQD